LGCAFPFDVRSVEEAMNNRTRFWTFVVLVWLLTGSPGRAQTHDHGAMVAADGEFNPYVISDNHEGFYGAYIERKTGLSNVILQHSQTAGSFSAGVRVNDHPGDAAVRNENPPKVALGPNNEVYVVWASERERWKGNIRFARSLNGGKTFQPAISLNSDASQQPISRAFESIVVGSNGRIFVAWIDERSKMSNDRGAEIWMATSEDHGKTFSHDRKILSDVCECCRTALAIDSTGKIYLSYRLVPSTGPMFRDIAVARSDDGGKTFKPTVVSHDGWELNGCPIDGATMTIDAADLVHVVWFTQTGEVPRLYIASSTDHGSSFTRPIIFDSSQKLAKHAHVVSAVANRVLVAWDDLDDGSMVKWGLFDPATKSTKILGIQRQASYPVIAMIANRVCVVAFQQTRTQLFRIVASIDLRD
jgi:hypothetical protein